MSDATASGTHVLDAWRKRWNWLDSLALPLATVLMYAAWFYPLLAVFLEDPSTGIRVPGLAFVLSLGILTTAVVAGRLTKKSSASILVVLVGSVVMIALSLLSVHRALWGRTDLALSALLHRAKADPEGTWVLVPVIATVISVVFLWWRGVNIERTRYESLSRSFTIGVVVLAGLIFLSLVLPLSTNLAAAESGEDPQVSPLLRLLEGMVPVSLLIFQASILIALILVALAHIIGDAAAAMSEWTVPIGLLFLGLVSPMEFPIRALIGPVLLFLASGLAALSLGRVSYTLQIQERKAGVRPPLDSRWLTIVLIIVLIILLLGLSLGHGLAPLMFKVSRFLGSLQLLPSDRWTPDPWTLTRRDRDVAPTPYEFSEGFELFQQIVLLVGAAITVTVIFLKRDVLLRMLNLFSGTAVVTDLDAMVERRESVFSWDLLLNQLRALLNRWRQREQPPPLFIDLGPPGSTRHIIRALYQRLLASAITLHVPRQKGETPKAYMCSLIDLCPQESSALETMTLAYVAARYGADPPSAEQVEATRKALARIERALRRRFLAQRPRIDKDMLFETFNPY